MDLLRDILKISPGLIILALGFNFRICVVGLGLKKPSKCHNNSTDFGPNEISRTRLEDLNLQFNFHRSPKPRTLYSSETLLKTI